ncbi:zeta toxin family protein [Streptomyces albovinaceus]|uniref:zeta toxin family protein n=1 Tax=Streptomyces albovinaceus TaxID=66867 RepID=UPI000A3BBE9F|nr:zeta toxin family protein [Streptomyces albovinaceus]
MSQDDTARYQLPAEENRRIFVMDIVRDLLTGPIPQDPATAVFLLGQPGAGKTRVAQLIAEQLDARGGFADIDSDHYKPYHPQYARLMAEDDRLMTLYTGQDGRAWMKQAQQFVRGEDPLSGGRKLNALVQEIAMDPQFLAETMRSYRNVGTRIEGFVLAVSQAQSDQGVLNRYHEQLVDRGQGRLTVPEKAQASFTGIPVACEVIVREGLLDVGGVFRRGDSDPRFAADAAELARDPLARPARRLRPPARPHRPAGRPAAGRLGAQHATHIVRCSPLAQHHHPQETGDTREGPVTGTHPTAPPPGRARTAPGSHQVAHMVGAAPSCRPHRTGEIHEDHH